MITWYKIYEVDFESYDDANKFAKAKAEVRWIEYKSVKYQAQKEVVRMKLKTKEMKE